MGAWYGFVFYAMFTGLLKLEYCNGQRALGHTIISAFGPDMFEHYLILQLESLCCTDIVTFTCAQVLGY